MGHNREMYSFFAGLHRPTWRWKLLHGQGWWRMARKILLHRHRWGTFKWQESPGSLWVTTNCLECSFEVTAEYCDSLSEYAFGPNGPTFKPWVPRWLCVLYAREK